MVAADTSSFIAFFEGSPGPDADALDSALADGQVCLPPVVLTELLSDPKLPPRVAGLLKQLPLLSPSEGFWERAGLLRAGVLAKGRKARLADSLIAQSCLDYQLALIARDRDFRNFARAAGLRLLP